jgi:hypothetical protein
MRSTMLCVLLLSAGALAGCASDADPAADAGAAGDGTMRHGAMHAVHHPAVRYDGCREQDLALPIPMDEARALVPEGFEPVPFQPGVPLGLVLVWTSVCEEGRIGEHPLEAAGEMWVHVAVTPPQEYEADGVDGYLVALGAVVSDQATARLYTSWGFAPGWVIPGSVSVAALGEGTPASVQAATVSDANFTMDAVTTWAGLSHLLPGGTLRVFIQDEDGLVGAFHSRYTPYHGPTEGGPAVLAVTPASPIPSGVEPYGGLGFPIERIGYANHPVALERHEGHHNRTMDHARYHSIVA